MIDYLPWIFGVALASFAFFIIGVVLYYMNHDEEEED